MNHIYYYIQSAIFIIIILEYVIFLFWFKKYINNYNKNLLCYIRIFIYTLFALFLLYIFFYWDILIKWTNFYWKEKFEFYKKSYIFVFYNPIIPIIKISIIQIFIVGIYLYIIVKIKEIFKTILNKKDYFILGSILFIWLVFRYFIEDNIWDTWYRQLSAMNQLLKWYNYFSREISEYGTGFYDLLDFFSKFINSNWKLIYTFKVNYFLDIFNIILIFVLSFILWWNKKVAFWNSLLYSTSIPILRFFSWEHLFVFWTNILLIMLICLNKFKEENYKNDVYYWLSLLCLVILIYSHNIFVLLPLFILFFFIFNFNTDLIKKILSKKYLFFYLLIFILLLPIYKIKTIWDFYVSSSWVDYMIKNLETIINNSVIYIYIFLFSPYNPYINLEINSYLSILLLTSSILFIWREKGEYKKLLLLIILYFILFIPYSLYFLPYFDNVSYSDIAYYTKYSSYKSDWVFLYLTDVMIKWSVTYIIFILLSWHVLAFFQSLIKNKSLKNIFIIFVSIVIIINPIINIKKINYHFSQQDEFNFFYENINNKLNSNKKYNVYYDSLWGGSFPDEFESTISSILSENKIDYNLLFIPDIEDELKFNFNKTNIYIISTSCYTMHVDSDKKTSCIINKNHNDIEFIPIFEKIINCETYDRESYCMEKKVKIWAYSIINKKELKK